MSRVIAIQNSFTSGELDPKLLARTDVEQYESGLTTALNVVVLPQGGIKRRPGLKYITELDSAAASGVRLVAFEFNTSDAYLLAFTNNKMYVIKDGVLQTNIAGSGNNYLTTTITSAMLNTMCWTQSADTLITVQEDMVPKKITRTSDTAWTIANVTFYFNPQYAPSFTIVDTSTSGTLTPSAVSGNITLTASSGSVFATAHADQYINIIGGNQFGRARIVERTSGTVVKAHVEIPFFDTAAIANANWELETGYVDTFSGAKGYPRSVCFHQGRLYFGGSKSRPSTIFASRVNEFFNFNPGEGNADDAFVATLDTSQLNAIVDIISANYLQIFTTGGEFFAPQEFSGIYVEQPEASNQLIQFFDISFAALLPVITASEFSFIFNVDLSSINIMATNPDFPVRILSPSSRILPALRLLNSFFPTFIISVMPFTFVATAILSAKFTPLIRNKRDKKHK